MCKGSAETLERLNSGKSDMKIIVKQNRDFGSDGKASAAAGESRAVIFLPMFVCLLC